MSNETTAIAILKKPRLLTVVRENVVSKNPMIAQLLGLCPLLAVTTTALNGLLLGVATLATLASAGVVIATLRPFIAHATRLPTYVIVIAVMVGIADILLEAFLYESYLTLGLFIPLIVTNCAIFATIEMSVARETFGIAVRDCLTRGVGLLLVLFVIGTMRELLASGVPGSLFDGAFETSVQVAILPPGAFFAMAALLAIHRWRVPGG